MTKTSLNDDKIRFINLHKSFFSELKNTSCDIFENKVSIYENSNQDLDPACVELKITDDSYQIYFWDGYSLADKHSTDNYDEALSQFKKFAKRLSKNLRRFSK